VKVLQFYSGDWQPPVDKGRRWTPCLCPFHDDDHPSASINFEGDAFNCHGCGEKGNAISLIMRKEGLNYRQALEFAEKLSPGGAEQVRGRSSGKPGRRVFGQPRSGGDRAVQAGLRRRTSPWS